MSCLKNCKTTVTVIVPVYNTGKYLAECLESIINQTYPKLQIIIIDDGSTDGSGGICDGYAASDDRIMVVHKKNGGLSDARNTGMGLTGGEYVLFCDSDDYLKADAIEQLLTCAKHSHADLVFFNAETLVETNWPNAEEKNYYIRRKSYSPKKGTYMLKELLDNGEYRSPVTLNLYKRKMLTEHHMHFVKGVIHEDEIFTPAAYLNSKKVSYLNKTLYVRRVREGSIMDGRFTVTSAKGYAVCVREYYSSYRRQTDGTGEKAVLKKLIADKANQFIFIYIRLEKKEREQLIAEYSFLRRILKKMDYCNDIKLKLKFEHPFMFKTYDSSISALEKIKLFSKSVLAGDFFFG